MQLFHKIENAVAIIRIKGGIHKQTDMYRRGDRVFIPMRGGYLRIVSLLGDAFGTADPNVSVLEFEADGVELMGGKEPRFVGEG